MSTDNAITTLGLDNGLDLRFIDQSKQIAEDRWYVCIMVRIDIPIQRKWFDDHPIDDLKFKDIQHVLGDSVVFEQKKDRNFVSADKKNNVVKEICDNTLQTATHYFGLDHFAAKYILKRYAEKMRH